MENLLSDSKVRPLHEGDLNGIKIILGKGLPLDPTDPGSVGFLVGVLTGEHPIPQGSHAWLLNPLGRLLLSWIFNPNRLRLNTKENKLYKACMAHIKTISGLRNLALDNSLELLANLSEDQALMFSEYCGSIGSYSMTEENSIHLMQILLDLLGLFDGDDEISDDETLKLLNFNLMVEEIEAKKAPEGFKWIEPKRRSYQEVDPPGDPTPAGREAFDTAKKPADGKPKVDEGEKVDTADDYHSLENVFKRSVWSLSDIQSDSDVTASAFTLVSYGPESDVYAYLENQMTFEDIMNDGVSDKSLKSAPFRTALRMILTYIHSKIPHNLFDAGNKNRLPAIAPGVCLSIDFSELAQLDPSLNFIVGLANERVLQNVDTASRRAFSQLCEIHERISPFPTASTLKHLWARTMPAGMSQVLVLAATFAANRLAPDNGLKGVILPPGNEKFYEGLRAASSVLKSSNTARGPISLTRTFMDASAEMRTRLSKLPNLVRVVADMALMQLSFGQLTSCEFEEKHLEEFGQLKNFELAAIGWAHLHSQSLGEAATTIEKLSSFSFVWSQLAEKDYLAQPKVILKALVAPGIHDLDALILKISALTALEPKWVSKAKPKAAKKDLSKDYSNNDWNDGWKSEGTQLKKQKTAEPESTNVKFMASKAIYAYWKKFNTDVQKLSEEEKTAICSKYQHIGLRAEERGNFRANKKFCTFAIFGAEKDCPFGDNCDKKHDLGGESLKL